MSEPVHSYDLLVVGGGLVGAAFAAAFARTPDAAGLKIGVLEPHPWKPAEKEPGPGEFDPRVVALTEASRRLLAGAGIWTDAVAARACPYHHMEVRDGEGTGFIEFDCSEVHRPDLGHIVENAVVVESAQRQLQQLDNVDFLCRSVSGLHRAGEADHLVLTLDDGARVSAPLVVAADGARSLVRERCDFRVRAWDYGQSAIIGTIRTEKPHGATAYQWFTPHGPLAFLPLASTSGDGHYVSIVWSQLHSVAEQLMAADTAEFLERMTRASEARLGQVLAVDERFCVPLHQSHAVDYIKPGVALMGDAAHSIHPLAGQGVNLGFSDAGALADEIVRGLQRGLPVGEWSTLSRYQRRRKPDNLAMMAAMEGFKRLFAGDNPLLRILRNRGMSQVNRLQPVKNQLIRRAMGF